MPTFCMNKQLYSNAYWNTGLAVAKTYVMSGIIFGKPEAFGSDWFLLLIGFYFWSFLLVLLWLVVTFGSDWFLLLIGFYYWFLLLVLLLLVFTFGSDWFLFLIGFYFFSTLIGFYFWFWWVHTPVYESIRVGWHHNAWRV